MDVTRRSRAHAALGDVARLGVVDLLAAGDLTVQEIATRLDIPGNLLAHHLNVLEDAGVVERVVSEGDRRRRYVTLRRDLMELLSSEKTGVSGSVVFVCSHNSARSQYAAAYWTESTGTSAASAGSEPAPRVHPLAVQVASERGLDLSRVVPRGYDSLIAVPDIVISVCDRAREGDLPPARRHIHWSVPDPVLDGRVGAFRSAFTEIEQRIEQLSPR